MNDVVVMHLPGRHDQKTHGRADGLSDRQKAGEKIVQYIYTSKAKKLVDRSYKQTNTDPETEDNKSFKEILDGGEVVIAVPEAAISKLIENGGFLSASGNKDIQSTGGTSVNLSKRKKSEQLMTGSRNVEELPVYGFLDSKLGRLEETEAGKWYGKLFFVPKQEARLRTTFTIGDSWANQSQYIPLSLDNPGNPFVLAPENYGSSFREDDQGLGRYGWGGPKRLYSGIHKLYKYIETQVHGGLSMDDIAEIRVPSDVKKSTVQLIQRRYPGIRITKYAPKKSLIVKSTFDEYEWGTYHKHLIEQLDHLIRKSLMSNFLDSIVYDELITGWEDLDEYDPDGDEVEEKHLPGQHDQRTHAGKHLKKGSPHQSYAQSMRSKESLSESGKTGYKRLVELYGKEFAQDKAAEWRRKNPTILETGVDSIIDAISRETGQEIKYEKETKVEGVRVDRFISPNIIIEVDGEPWHSKNSFTGIDRAALDAVRDNALINAGYLVYRFREEHLSNGQAERELRRLLLPSVVQQLTLPVQMHLPGRHNQDLHGREGSVKPSTFKLKQARKLLEKLKAATPEQMLFVRKLMKMQNVVLAVKASELDLKNQSNVAFLKMLGFSLTKPPESQLGTQGLWIDATSKKAQKVLSAVSAVQQFFGGGNEKTLGDRVKIWGNNDFGLELLWAVSQMTLKEDEYVLMRGMIVDQNMIARLAKGRVKRVDVDTIGHWTTDAGIAQRFGGNTLMFIVKIPKEAILFHHEMIEGYSYGEFEYVPIFQGSPRVFSITPYEDISSGYKSLTLDLMFERTYQRTQPQIRKIPLLTDIQTGEIPEWDYETIH